MPPIWRVTAILENNDVANVTAAHTDDDGNVDSTFSSRLKIAATDDIDKFIALAKEKLVEDSEKKGDASDLVVSIEGKLNS